MSSRGRLRRLEASLRGKLGCIELADGSRRWYDRREVGTELFPFSCDWLRAQARGGPYPESYPDPPELLLAVAGAKDKAAALTGVFGDAATVTLVPIEPGPLVERGELVYRSLVAGRSLGEPAEELCE